MLILGGTVLVTGAAKGIGGAIARVFAENGYSVAINYFKSEADAKNLVEYITKNGGVCSAFYADITKIDDVNFMVEGVKKNFGFVDVLINNAAVAQQKLFLDTSLEDWQHVFDANVFGMFNVCKKILPDMIKHKNGKIINISSIWGEVGACCESVYSASKAAVIGFSKALAKEVSLSGINVNCIAPGVIKTDMLNNLNEAELEVLKDKIPLNRFGRAEDVAKAALFLASNCACYITGEVLNVGGGFYL